MDELGSARGSSNAKPMMQVPALQHIEEFESLTKKMAPLKQKLENRKTDPSFKKSYQQWLARLKKQKKPKLPKTLSKIPIAKWKAKQKKVSRLHYLTKVDSAGISIQKQLAKFQTRYNALIKSGSKVMVMADMANPRQTHLLLRGTYNKPGEKVCASTPNWLPPMKKELPRNRLGLAKWLTDPQHPRSSAS